MNFDNIIVENIIYTPEMKSIIQDLKSELFKDSVLKKIQFDINTNWSFYSIVDSITLTSTIILTLRKYIPDLSLKISHTMKSKGKIIGNEIFLNYKRLSEASKMFEALRKKNKVDYLNDFIIETIDTLLHELVHHVQNQKSNYKGTDNDKYYDSKKELMAFSAAIIDELKEKGYTKKEIYKILESGEDEEGFEPSSRLINIKKYNTKNYNAFLKYCYQYMENN